MRRLRPVIMIAVLLAGSPIVAADEHSATIKPSFTATETVTATARVEAIDHESRQVTLLFQNGDLSTSRIDEEARNLNQVGVGDIVYAHYTESISVQVVANDGSEPDSYVEDDIARTVEGQRPGMAALKSVVTTAIVEAINLDDNTFDLREPDGKVYQYTAQDPDNLRRAEVGDKVITTATTSVVITVDKQPNE